MSSKEAKEAIKRMPWPVTLIGAAHEGRYNVMTASWVSQVSFNPLMVMVSIAPERYTYELIQKSGEFVVSILAKEQVQVANFCGSRSGKETDKIEELKLKTQPGKVVKVPLLQDCIANLECKVVATQEAGDHVIFIGEVVAGSVVREDAIPLLMLNWKPGSFVPL
ncbi:MAG: Flavin reductase domain protein FMN-binding protein [Thermoanaerobacterales bacterium 50_218]|nr:MAG: Flavin reductase domain protein FMN-binding protein [Thermoanaerobacterales bacterium 50_218]HAA89932.1 flavin reductase [Peptococcaceae bacterium]